MDGVIFTCVRRDPAGGFWTAHVSIGGDTFLADRSSGSWVVHDPAGGVREALFPVAAELQARVRRLERREREQAEAREPAAA